MPQYVDRGIIDGSNCATATIPSYHNLVFQLNFSEVNNYNRLSFCMGGIYRMGSMK